MPRRLSDVEWSMFLNEVNLPEDIPPWGAVVQWQNMFISVYICQADGTLCRKGEVMLADVTDQAPVLQNITRRFDPNSLTWWYYMPGELMATIVGRAKQVIEGTGIVIQKVAEATGAAAGAITKPILENVSLPLIVLGVVILFMYLPRGRTAA